jgi:peptidyl-prolyl cis-trans isomerase B (cyclophilin B)
VSVSGKQHKRELRRQKEAVRAATRREERKRTIQTIIVVCMVVVIGGVLVFVSLDRPADVADEPTDAPSDPLAAEVTPADPGVAAGTPGPGATPAVVRSDVAVACEAAEPPDAGATRPLFNGGPARVLEFGQDYRAVVQTSCGRVVIDLNEQSSPIAVNSFVFLARQGFFNGLEIFRNATSIGALQTGAGTNQATWDVGYTIRDELETAQLEGYPPGAVAMANAGANTAGSQFFFVYNDKFQLDPLYSKFGTVVEGLDVLQRIGAIPAAGEQMETPTQRTYMESVTIEATPSAPAPQG